MSDSDESGVTYTEVSSPFEGLSDIGSPRADDHEYLELPGMPEDPYVEAALQAPPSPDYVPGPEEPEQAPPSPDYVPGPEHADDEIVAEDQPYAEDASPTAQSPDYVPESDPEADPEEDDDEDPEEDPVASCSVSIVKQLKTDAMWCYFDAILTLVEQENFKEAMLESSWIEAMQEEIHEFERMQVWELVPCMDIVMLINLKWIFKVKKNECGGVLKNKARLVAKGYRQEEEIDFETCCQTRSHLVQSILLYSQEPPTVPVKQTYDSSGKLKGVEILFDVAMFDLISEKQTLSRYEIILQPHASGSRVKELVVNNGFHDELTEKICHLMKRAAFSHEDEEVFRVVPRDENPKSPPSGLSDNDDLNESEDDDDKRVETDDDDDERVETNDDRDNEEEQVDRSTDIEETDAEMEKEMSDEKLKGNEQATEAQPNDDKKDKFKFYQPTSSQSLSSGFTNQFLLNSLNASRLETITEPTEGDITSMLDVPIQQDVPKVVQEPLHVVTVTVILEATQPPPPPPATMRFSEMEQFVKQLRETNFSSVIHDSIMSQVTSIVEKYLGSSLPNAFRKELQANNAALKKELSELNYKEVIEESVKANVSVKAHAMNEDIIEESMKAHVVNEVKNFLSQILTKAVSDFAKPMLQDAIAKSLISLAQSSSSHQSAIEAAKTLSELELKNILYDKMLKSGSSCSHKTHEELFNALTWSITLDESKSTQRTKSDQIPKKQDHGDDDQDEDPSAGSNQGKETKKKRTGKENLHQNHPKVQRIENEAKR
ncbi:copia protein [Tanacetum coccineum]